jgi:hypothetical protein
MKDTKEYAKVLEILLDISTSKQKINRLTKIWSLTEDDDLKELIAITNRHIEPRAHRKNTESVEHIIREEDPKFSQIINYCHACIKSEKPQWQIIAERNGWRKLVVVK